MVVTNRHEEISEYTKPLGMNTVHLRYGPNVPSIAKPGDNAIKSL